MSRLATNREYVASGRYDYWAVDEYHPDEPGNGIYGSSITGLRTKKLAQEIAGALNTAYRNGRKDERGEED